MAILVVGENSNNGKKTFEAILSVINMMEEEIIKSKHNVREHLANERTLLAWIRTSIAIMAFGFVVVKFSLFIEQVSQLLNSNVTISPQIQRGYSSLIGILLVTIGVIVLMLSYFKYKRTEKQLNNESFKPSSILILSLTITILSIGIFLILYLMKNINRY